MEAELNNKCSLYIAMWPGGDVSRVSIRTAFISRYTGTHQTTSTSLHLQWRNDVHRRPTFQRTDSVQTTTTDGRQNLGNNQRFLEEQAELLVLEEFQWWMHYSHSAQLVALILYSLYLWNIDQPYFNGHLSCRADRKCSLARLTANTSFLSSLLLASTQSAHF